MSDDAEEIYATCPKCDHSPIKRIECNAFCDEGRIDESEDDPINFMPGESIVNCSECQGTGFIIWCPNCNADLTGQKIEWDEDE